MIQRELLDDLKNMKEIKMLFESRARQSKKVLTDGLN